MKFKYYDALSQLVMGYLVLIALMMAFEIKYDNSYSIPYLACAFVIGYFLNAVSSILEDFFYWTIGGRPSDNLLKIKGNKKYTGTYKVRFYETYKVVELLKNDIADGNTNERRLFSKAMRDINGNEKSRVPDFNAHYAFSRIVLTAMLAVTILFIIKYPCYWQTYLIFIPLFLSWERYKQRGYYYAREVLNEYLKLKNK